MKRQVIHFTPEKGWINDPNGLIFVDGWYHVFYQHYPDDTKWGPMHWGHARSRDLIHFEHLPIALFPTEDEYIFSGSAVLDYKNVSGLKTNNTSDGNEATIDTGDEHTNPAMLLFYTSHNPKTGEQMQSIAYSFDYVNFTKYNANPVIENNLGINGYKKDFRDPKIIANENYGGYTMVLAAGDKIEFYHSTNLLKWEYTGNFYPGKYGFDGICECPDLLILKNDDRETSVLTMSMVFTEGNVERHVMQYFVGQFDGKSFTNTQSFDKRQILDYGDENYAMVSFAESQDLIMLGWGEDWNKARVNNSTDYFGKMTLPRKINLLEIDGRYYLTQKFVLQDDIQGEQVWRKKLVLALQERIELRYDFAIENVGEYLHIGEVIVPRALNKECELDIIFDNDYMEILADGGIISFSRDFS